jgi:cell division protein FtsQ
MNRGAIPIVAQPDERYWRRRANRRVRKARLTRTLRRWSAFGVASAIIGTALFQAASYAVEEIVQDESLVVQRIEVDGALRRDAASIRERLASYYGHSIVDVDLRDVADVAAGDPWVASASAKRVLPGTLHVTIVERHPAAVAVIDDVEHVVDANGVRVAERRPGTFAHLPRITGLGGGERATVDARLLRGIRALERLRRAAGVWVGEIAGLDLSRPDRIAVRTVDPGPAILLDPQRVECNLNRYLELRREIAAWAGPLEYVDLRWQDHIAVRPTAHATPPREKG